MMKSRSLLNGLVAAGVALALVSTLAAQTVVQASAKVTRIKGSARYKIGSSGWQPLKRGDVLRAGALIEAGGNDSYVDLVLGERGAPPVLRPAAGDLLAYHPSAEQNTIRVWQNSRLGIDKLTVMETGADVVTETQLDLQAGHILANVRKMSAASKYEVKIPNGVASVRGSTVDISAEGLVRVLVGSVFLRYTDSGGKDHTQVIMSLQEFDARTGVLQPLPDVDKTSMLDTVNHLLAGLAIPVSFMVDETVTLISPH
jgi:hypothetical protein